jgi:hypothetical protein
VRHALAAGQAFAIAAGLAASQLVGQFLRLKLILENATALDAFSDAATACGSGGVLMNCKPRRAVRV